MKGHGEGAGGELQGTRARAIKRYANRKLYDATARRYVTLEDLAGAVAAGAEITVLDQESGDDVTSVVLAQVILDGLKERTARIPRQVLTRIIRLGRDPRALLRESVAPAQEAASRAGEEAERIVSGLIRRGRLSLGEAVELRQEIAESVHRIVSDAQHGIESRLRGLLDRTEKEGGVSPSLQALRERLLSLETYLGSASAGRKPRPGTRPGRRGERKKH
jgi:polyhydroxyalkanoate synthesis repressor PhaR